MKLLYFAWVKQKIGRGEEDIAVPSSVDSVGTLMTYLSGLGAEYAAAFANPERLRCAVNQQHVGFDAKVSGNDEVAFFPPVTGG